MAEERTTIELTRRLEAIVSDIGEFTKTHVSYAGADFDGFSENDILAAAWPALRKHQVLTLPDVISHDVVERIKLDKTGKEIIERFIIARLAVTFRAIGTEEFVTLHCEGMACLQDDKALSKATSDANKSLWRKITQAYAKPSAQRGRNSNDESGAATGRKGPSPQAAAPPRSQRTESGALRMTIPRNAPKPTVEIEDVGSADQPPEAKIITGFVHEYQDQRDGKPMLTPSRSRFCVVKVAGLPADNKQDPHDTFYCYHAHLLTAASLMLGEVCHLVVVTKIDKGTKKAANRGVVWQSIEDVRRVGKVEYRNGVPLGAQ